jgi:hypothetical protein
MDDDLDTMFNDDNKLPTEVVADPPVATVPDSDQTGSGDTPAGEAEGDAPEQPQTPPSEDPKAQDESPVEKGEPAAQEQPKPLTAEEVRQIMSDVRDQERNSGKALEEAEKEVLAAYYPQGLSNTLVDESTGKEIRSPQDVVDLSGGTMTTEQATQWLMNEQYKLDKQVADIKSSARELAEVNSNFKQGATRVIEKYKPIFDKYPQLQSKVYKNYMKTVKLDAEKDLILSAPDIEDYYADVMEPYVMAFGFQPAPAAAPAAPAAAIPVSKQTAADRMDVGGDVGGDAGGGDIDPNDAEATLNKFFGE